MFRTEAEFHEVEDVDDMSETDVKVQRFARDVLDQAPVNDYVSILRVQDRTKIFDHGGPKLCLVSFCMCKLLTN